MSLPCSLYVLKTNVGYSAVAEIIVHSEMADNIQGALEVLKQWNLEWCPSYVMMDYLEAPFRKHSQLQQSSYATFTGSKHRCSGHVTTSMVYHLLMLKNCLIYFEHVLGLHLLTVLILSVNQLKQSPIWRNHQSVLMWLTNYCIYNNAVKLLFLLLDHLYM